MVAGKEVHLNEVFQSFTVSELKDLCRLFELKGISTMKKAALIQNLVHTVTQEEVFQQICFQATPEEMKIFEGAFKKHFLEESECKDLCYWVKFGFCFVDNSNKVSVVKELQTMYHTLGAEFWSQYNRFYEIYEYIEAAIHLYGVIGRNDAIHLFNHWHKEKMGKEELEQFFDIIQARPEVMDFNLDEELIFDEVLLDAEERYFAYEAVYERQGKGPYFMPAKEEFLRYVNPDYFEKNKEYLKLEQYLIDTFQVNHYIAEDMCEDMVGFIRLGYQVDDILADLDRKGIPIDPFHAEDLTELVLDLMNNTRSMFCKGFTFKEAGEEVLLVTNKKNGRHSMSRGCNGGEGSKIIPFPGNYHKQ